METNPASRTAIAVLKYLLGALVLLLLVALFFPVYRMDPIRARETTCASNMKQLGLGFIQYSQDYDGKWPGGADRWAGEIYPYEKSASVYHCPDDSATALDGKYPVSYAMNANLRGRNVGSPTNGSVTVLAIEHDCKELTDMTRPEQSSQYTVGTEDNTAWGGIRLGTTAEPQNPTRHDPYLIVLASDGHLKMLRPDKVSSGIDNRSADGSQDAVHAAGTMRATGEGTAYTLTFSGK